MTKNIEPEKMHIRNKGKIWRRFTLNISLIIVLFLMGIFIGFVFRTNEILKRQILSTARAHFKNIVLTRKWNAIHGGVFVKKEAGIVSNPYLENPDIQAIDGTIYTKKNPALMTREISEIAEQAGDFRYHITSLLPLNPDNYADDFEKAALMRFEKGAHEQYAMVIDGKTAVYRYMAPLFVDKSCLSCHAKQKYKIGDIRGGISVTFDISEFYKQMKRNHYVFVGLSVVVSSILLIIIHSFVSSLARRLDQTMRELKDLNENLELKVQERTTQLEIAKKEAEQSEEIKSNFLANVSHELKTPLNAVVGYGHILSTRYKDPNDLKYLKKIESSSNNLVLVIDDLLAMSQMKATQQESNLHPQDISIFLYHLKAMVIEDAEQKGLNLQLSISPDLPGALLLDEVRLRHVVLNILRNAIKFTTRGSIRLSATGVNVDIDNQNLDLVIRVEDTGIGITNEFIDQVFDEFKQQDGSSTRKYGGLGLGLSVAKKLVELMGGTITVKSEFNKGSTFEVILKNTKISDTTAVKPHQCKNDEDRSCVTKQIDPEDIAKNTGDLKHLLNLLVELEPHAKKKKTKPCKEIVQQISQYAWPADIADELSLIEKCIKKYRYDEALPGIASLIKRLLSLQTDTRHL